MKCISNKGYNKMQTFEVKTNKIKRWGLSRLQWLIKINELVI